MAVRALRVLLIDDHAPFRAAARELLERRGFAVVAEAEGARAGLAAAQAVAPDAVVLDVQLPDGNGIDVCRALTQPTPGSWCCWSPPTPARVAGPATAARWHLCPRPGWRRPTSSACCAAAWTRIWPAARSVDRGPVGGVVVG